MAAPQALADELAERYADEHIAAARAVELGAVDAVIAPAQTRRRLADGLGLARASRGRALHVEPVRA